jgi:uncharacterized repeat protein (TIGR01451 family)
MKARNLISVVLGAGILLVFLLYLVYSAPPATANPDIFYVQAGAAGDCSSGNPCGSVQQAINLAEEIGDGNEVYVAAGAYIENITVTYGIAVQGGWDQTFTTQDPSANPTIIDGQGEHNVIVDGNAPSTEIVVAGFILENGRDGFHIEGGDVTVAECTIRDAAKQGIEINGGTVLVTATQVLTAKHGIDIDGGVARIVNSHFAHTREEGLFFNGGTVVTVTHSTVMDAGQQGVQIDSGTIYFAHNRVTHVISEAIFITGGDVQIIDTEVLTAPQGIDIKAGTVQMDNVTVAHTTGEGVVVRVSGSDPLPDVTMRNSTIEHTGEQGLRISAGTVRVINSTIRHGAEEGVAILYEDGADPPNVAITNSAIEHITRQGVEVETGQVELSNNRIANTVQEGLLVKYEGLASSPVVTATQNILTNIGEHGLQVNAGQAWLLDNHLTDVISNGIRAQNSTVVVADNVIERVTGDQYPGIYVRDTNSAIIRGNYVADVADHGIFVDNANAVIAANEVISTAKHGLNVRGGNVTVEGNTVRNAGSDGIHTQAETQEVTIRDNVVVGAGDDGIDARGARVWVIGNHVTDSLDDGLKCEEIGAGITIAANRIFNNAAMGIAVRTTPAFTITNNFIGDHISNTIELEDPGQGVIYHNTLVGASAGQQGKGIEIEGPMTVTIINNIIINHEIGVTAIPTAEVVLDHTLLWNNASDPLSGTVVVQADPQFVDLAGYDYHLQETSPAIDAGTDVGVDIDIDGDPRPQDAAPDLGADEIAAPAELVITKSGPATAEPGAPITYTLTITNLSESPCAQMVITDQVPTGATVITHTQEGSAWLPAPSLMRWDEITLTGGATTTVSFIVQADHSITNDDYAVACADGRSARGQRAVETTITSSIYLPLIMRNANPGTIIISPPSAYHISASPADLAWLAERPYYNDTVPATFFHERGWEVDLRYRGDTSRLMPKKSWKLFFPGSDLFQGNEELNLNADYIDQTLLRSAVGYNFLARAGIPTPHAKYARVYLNGEYAGLYSQVEQIDERFLHRLGIDMQGNLYKGYGNLEPPKPHEDHVEWWADHYSKKTHRDSGLEDIRTFVGRLNTLPETEFPTAIAEMLDVNEWFDWYAANILLGNFEMLSKNYYLYHDFSRETWIVLPWDVDLSLGHNAGWHDLFDETLSWDNPIDSGTLESKKIDGKWNVLIERMMNIPEFRYFHGRRLIEMLASPDGAFSPEAIFPYIDGYFAAIQPYGEADLNRWRPEGFEFAHGPDEIEYYVTHRREWLYEHLPAFMPDLAPPLVLNEVLVHNTATLSNAAGAYAPWLEIYNASEALTWDLGGMYLSLDTDDESGARWEIPAGTNIPPQGALLIWADGAHTLALDHLGDKELHASFTLTTSGMLTLWDRDAFDRAVIFQTAYDAPDADLSVGRALDGGDEWSALDAPTPGWRNIGRAPTVTEVTRTPARPSATNAVTIAARISDAGPITATLWYRAFAPEATPGAYVPIEMTPTPGDDGDLYSAVIPAQPATTWVEYYITAEDATGQVSESRPRWPESRYDLALMRSVGYHYIVGWERPSLVINEVMARNRGAIEDAAGGTPDWIEIHNTGARDIDLQGMFITDDPHIPTQYKIPESIIVPAGGYTLLWAGGEPGGDHLPFKLSGAGEAVALFDTRAAGLGQIDASYFAPQPVDVSWGRYPDGGDAWHAMYDPTPGAPNRLQPPAFAQLTRAPRWPAANESVAVTAHITAGQTLARAVLWYDAGSGFEGVLCDLAARPEGRVVTATAQIPPQAAGQTVRYYVMAEDALEQAARYPPGAPDAADGYHVGYTPPALVINEFLASNDRVNSDEAGEYDDWVEIYNAGETTASLGGLYLSDHLDDPRRWQIPADTELAPGAHLLIWCDGDPEQGALHTPFKLAREGEAVGLFAANAHGNIPLDYLTYGMQTPDTSYGRRPDGGAAWVFFTSPTPGGPNE